MGITSVAKKFTRNAADYGLGRAVKKGVLYSVRSLYEKRTYRIYGLALDKYEAREAGSGEFSYALVSPGDRQLIGQLEAMEEWLEGEIAAKLNGGGLCLVALGSGTVAGFNLVSFGRIYMPLVNLHRDFGKRTAWSEQITVGKRYRGKGLGVDLRLRMFSELKKRGIKKFYGGTLSDNEPNLRLTRKVGFREIADITYTKLFNQMNWTCKRVSR